MKKSEESTPQCQPKQFVMSKTFRIEKIQGSYMRSIAKSVTVQTRSGL
jgi:hypothetical protein